MQEKNKRPLGIISYTNYISYLNSDQIIDAPMSARHIQFISDFGIIQTLTFGNQWGGLI